MGQIIIYAEDKQGEYNKRPYPSDSGQRAERGLVLFEDHSAKHWQLNDEDQRERKRKFQIEKCVADKIELHRCGEFQVSEQKRKAFKIARSYQHPEKCGE